MGELYEMELQIKHYPQKRLCGAFDAVIAFLKEHGAKGLNKNWHWARWEWLLAHPSLDESTLPSIGLFMDGGKLTGLVTHDMRAQTYILVDPRYAFLKPRMVDYAMKELSHGGVSGIFVDEQDQQLISAAREKGYMRAAYDETVLELDCSKELPYSLKPPFYLTDYETDRNLDRYEAVIHRGFENKGDPPTGLTEADISARPHENPRLAVFAAAPDGDYAAHCGTWYQPDTEICYVEPVVTVPECRKLGLGGAVVYESINRCSRLGAKKAIVISDQTFYHRIGFKKYAVCHLWEKKMV